MKRKIKTILAIAGLLILSFLLYVFIPSYPKTGEFYKLISESDSIVVKELKIIDDPSVWEVVFQSSDKADIETFKKSLVIKKQPPISRSYSKCPGSPWIYFYKNGQETIRITNHHNESIRCDLWKGNVDIASVDEWKTWLDTHGVTEEEK